MTASTTVPEVLRTDGFDVSSALDVDQLIHAMNDLDATRNNEECGFHWLFSTAPGDWEAETLDVGVRGSVGALMWFTATEAFVPEHGLNTEHVEYYSVDTHVMPMAPGAEVSIEDVHAALREFARTEKRPTCIQWRAFDPFKP